ncbi:MAG: asparagine synthase C-terminal domain-containing protein, partial [Parvibaculaceae bacterium]|nr:asparagine synthase C-terminal domain-containing protein [Parvibaculaceae bacterium]
FSDLFKGDISSWREPDLSTPPDLTAIQAKQYLDIQDWLPCDLLTKLDRCTMAYGLEGRVPFLDGALAAYCFGLPDGLKIQGRTGKYLLKKWLSEAQSAINPWEKKKGFTVPVREWLEKKREVLASRLVGHDGLADIVHMTELAKLFDAPFGKREGQIVFNLLCYSLWFDVHIKGRELQEL